MAYDLATTPSTDLRVQANGDAHLANFGIYDTPERNVVFDLNDFDESLPGPWEWDIKRLATSIVLAGRASGFHPGAVQAAVLAASGTYRERLADFARMGYLAVWCAQVDEHAVLQFLRRAADTQHSDKRSMVRHAAHAFADARHQSELLLVAQLARVVQGELRFVESPPVVVHEPGEQADMWRRTLLESYQISLQDDRRSLLERFTLVDVARKVVGVGSVGTRCHVLLLYGRGPDDPLLLQVKEATASVLEPYLGHSQYPNHGQRVVNAQQRTQAAPDSFLGWGATPEIQFYVRQLRHVKGVWHLVGMTPTQLDEYARLCGWALARAHARSGDPALISGYLGTSDRFDHAVATFAQRYADQTERDHAELVKAVQQGRLAAELDV